MDRFTSLSVFVRVVELGSFSAAATDLNMSQPSVSKHVSALEQYLGARLLNRSTRRLSLTEIGSDFFERAKMILAELSEAEQRAGAMQGKPRGALKVNVGASFGRLFLSPKVPEFLRRFPELDLELMLNDRVVDLVQEGVDCALRIGALADSALIAARIGETRRLVAASPAYLEAHGRPEHPMDLVEHNCLQYTFLSTGAEWRFNGPDGPFGVRVRGRYMVNSAEALTDAAIGGGGIVMLPYWALAEGLNTAQLVRILDAYEAEPLPMHVVYPPTRHVPLKVRVFIDFMQEQWRAYIRESERS